MYSLELWDFDFVGIDELCEKKRFRLKKLLTTIRKSKAMSKRKK